MKARIAMKVSKGWKPRIERSTVKTKQKKSEPK